MTWPTRLARTLVAVKVPLLVAAFVVAVQAAPPAVADPNQFPSLSDYYTVNPADYRTYRAYLTTGVQFATPGGYRCRMSFTQKQNGAYMECWGALPAAPNNANYVALHQVSIDFAAPVFSTIDLSKMENVPPGADGTGGPVNPSNYKLLPARNRIIFDEGPVQTCGVDTSMTACELTDQGQVHGFVLSPQGSWGF